ncbi:glycosyltransferase family 4 protein [Niallia sp. Sow4_A1]|uniref:glycosyltransferase family 4 protein n=1 Tax=Niallia sp. Sow4_A1 TaxID=3438793 RepID=UPI003F9CE15E
MHIGIVSHNILKGDGQGRVNYEIVKRALGKGHEVTVFCTAIESDLLSHSSLHWKRVQAESIPIILLKSQYFAWKSTRLIQKEKNDIDVLLVNGFTTWAKSNFNAVHFVHSKWIQSKVHPIRNKVSINTIYQLVYSYMNSKLEKIAFNRTDKIITVSEKVKKELIETAKVKSEKIYTIFNGVDTVEFHPRQTVKQQGEPTIALFAGDIRTNRKNLDTALKAIKSVPNILLRVAGNTDGSPYPQMVKDMQIEDKVEFLGFQKNVNELMRTVDMFLFPSRYEACSLVVLEALASGLPVVTTIESGLAEVINDSKGNGGIVLDNPEDVATLTMSLISLTENKELRNRMSENARRIAEENTWIKMADAYLSQFETLVSHENRNKRLSLHGVENSATYKS